MQLAMYRQSIPNLWSRSENGDFSDRLVTIITFILLKENNRFKVSDIFINGKYDIVL